MEQKVKPLKNYKSMINFTDIEINKFQFNSLLNHREKEGFKYLLKNDVCCNGCNSTDNLKLTKYKLYLDRFNDIKVSGECADCGTPITHVMPFGHSETFFRKAIQFRHKVTCATEG